MKRRASKIFTTLVVAACSCIYLMACEVKPSQSAVGTGSVPLSPNETAISSTANRLNRADGRLTVRPQHQGGDHLPVVVDPESPASCAVVAKGERCGDCCSDVFTEDSERWHQCMNACTKVEASNHEH